jgi:hypothetical protein
MDAGTLVFTDEQTWYQTTKPILAKTHTRTFKFSTTVDQSEFNVLNVILSPHIVFLTAVSVLEASVTW